MSKSLAPISIKTMDDAVAALEEMEAIGDEIKEKMARQVDLKKSVTTWAVAKKVDVVQLEGGYYRQINRSSRFWVGEPSDMPDPAPRGAKSLREICKGLTAQVNGKTIPLWNYITKRVPDPEKIDKAVDLGFITDAKISKAYIEKPQVPFLQRFAGEAHDE